MKTFKIMHNDIVINGLGNIEMISGKDEEVQSIERILTTNTGEWFLNQFHGLNYDEIRGKSKEIASIKLAFIEAISQDYRVREVTDIDIKTLRKTRELKVSFKYSTFDEEDIIGEEVLSIE